MLDALPREIFSSILEHLPNRKDLSRLCLVSRKLYNLAVPNLYETIIIKPQSENQLKDIDTGQFVSGNAASRLQYVKHIRISALFRDKLYERCPHHKSQQVRVYRETGKVEVHGSQETSSVGGLGEGVLTIFHQLNDESLKSFCWEMGTCIPEGILGPAGYLSLKQTSLESITLITDSDCGGEKAWEDSPHKNLIDLSKFHALRRFAWIGFHRDGQLRTLSYALKANSRLLTHLQLEGYHVYWYEEDPDSEDETRDENGVPGGYHYFNIEDRKSVNVFARNVFGLKQPPTTSDPIFPALKSLSLAFIPLEKAQKALVYAFNAAGLSHLTLRSCRGMEGFIKALASSKKTIKLSSLHYSYEGKPQDWCGALLSLFHVAPDLTDLFLQVSKPDDPHDASEFWHGIARRFPPLTRFVYHQRNILGDDLDYDGLDSPRNDERLEIANTYGTHPLTVWNSIRFLGLCAYPSTAKLVLTSTESNATSVEFLHLRRSGKDLAEIRKRGGQMSRPIQESRDTEDVDTDLPAAEDELVPVLDRAPKVILEFAEWAFGLKGIPSLQVFAYGDFSFDDRFENYIFCRGECKLLEESKKGREDRTLPFHPIRDSDISMRELVDDNMDFLAACPTDTLLLDPML